MKRRRGRGRKEEGEDDEQQEEEEEEEAAAVLERCNMRSGSGPVCREHLQPTFLEMRSHRQAQGLGYEVQQAELQGLGISHLNPASHLFCCILMNA